MMEVVMMTTHTVGIQTRPNLVADIYLLTD